jgi:hypothetical protein
VALESTGVYWKPVYYVLEDAFELLLINMQTPACGGRSSADSVPFMHFCSRRFSPRSIISTKRWTA